MNIKKLALAVFLVFVFSLLPLSVYGRKSWFFASDYVSYVALGVSLPVAFFLAYLFSKKVKPNNMIGKKKSTLAIVIITPLVLLGPVSSGIPALISKSFSSNQTVISEIVEVKHRMSGRGCRYEIMLKQLSGFLKPGICVEQSLFAQLKVGDSVRLDLNKSILGIRIFTISIVKDS